MFLMQTKMLGVPVGTTLLEKPRAPVGRWQMHIQNEAELQEPSSFQKGGPEERVTATGTCGGPAKAAVGLAQLSTPTGHRTCSRARPQRWVT